MRRLWFRARVKFHDLLWTAALHSKAVTWVGAHLPLYISDPHMPSKEWLRGFDVGADLHPAGGMFVTDNSAATLAAGTTVTLTYVN